MLEGLTILRAVTGISDSTEGATLNDKIISRRGILTLKRVYGRSYDRLLDNLKSLHDELPGLIVRNVYGQIVSRPGLALKEREIVNVAVLTIQKLNQQLYSHIRGALRLGVSAETVEGVIRLAARISHVPPASALSILAGITTP